MLECRTWSHCHVYHNRTLVLRWDKTCLGGSEEISHRYNRKKQYSPECPAALEEEVYATLILRSKRVERSIKGLAEACGEALLLTLVLVVRLEHKCTQCWRERKGVDARDTYGNSHRDTELCIEDTRRATHHRHGDKHSHKDKCRGEDRRRDTSYGIHRCGVCRAVACLELGVYGLNDNHSIVDNCTDSEY